MSCEALSFLCGHHLVGEEGFENLSGAPRSLDAPGQSVGALGLFMVPWRLLVPAVILGARSLKLSV